MTKNDIMELNAHNIKKIIKSIAVTKDQEFNCDECFHKIEQFVELKISGKSPETAMPLVEHHLNLCNECRKEYEILREAIQQLDN